MEDIYAWDAHKAPDRNKASRNKAEDEVLCRNRRCDKVFVKASNRQEYCPECAIKIRKEQERLRHLKRKQQGYARKKTEEWLSTRCLKTILMDMKHYYLNAFCRILGGNEWQEDWTVMTLSDILLLDFEAALQTQPDNITAEYIKIYEFFRATGLNANLATENILTKSFPNKHLNVIEQEIEGCIVRGIKHESWALFFERYERVPNIYGRTLKMPLDVDEKPLYSEKPNVLDNASEYERGKRDGYMCALKHIEKGKDFADKRKGSSRYIKGWREGYYKAFNEGRKSK